MKKRNGFTLIELLAVIVILAIIALIATPMVLKYIEKSRNEADLNSLRAIEHAAELYYTANMDNDDYDKTIYFPDEDNVLGLKGTKPTDGMVSISDSGKIKVIATINGKTYMTEGAGLFGTNHYFKATGSITATDAEWEYEKINDTDVRLTKYKGYKYHYKDDLNDLNIVSETTYKDIKERMEGPSEEEKKEQEMMEQMGIYFQASIYNITFPIAERKTLDEMLALMGLDETMINSIDSSVKKEGMFFFDLVQNHFADKYENGVNTEDETEMTKFQEETMKLIENNKKQLPILIKIISDSNEEQGIKYLTTFIFPARLKTSEGTYNVTEIGNGQVKVNDACGSRNSSLFESVKVYTSCSNGSSFFIPLNEFDKIIIPEGVQKINSYALDYLNAKELSLPNTLKELRSLTNTSDNEESLRDLQELKIPANVEIIYGGNNVGGFVGRDQSSLKRVVFEGLDEGTSKLKSINSYAFVFSGFLGDITINVPGNITEMNAKSFTICPFDDDPTTKLNIIIKKDDCSNFNLVDSNNVKYTCQP